jgi:hypothetical protein
MELSPRAIQSQKMFRLILLASLVALVRWRGQFDIGLEETSRPIAVGEFDITIEG